jgi:GR25 family glycosyltransferase involved in LPS biosynthesis
MRDSEENVLVSLYMLSLKNRFRAQNLVNFLDTNKLHYKIIWALEPGDFPRDFLNSLVDQRKAKYLLGRNLSLSEVSCSLGHFEMYEEFLSSKSEWGLFLEDDAMLSSGIHKLLSRLIRIDKPIVLTLASAKDERFGPNPFPFMGEIAQLNWMPGFNKCCLPPVLAHAYLMNRKAAEIAVHSLRGKRIYAPADFPFEFRNLVDFYASEEFFAVVGDFQSTIEADRMKQYSAISPESTEEKIKRRMRVIFDYSGLGILWAKHLGISGRFYYREKILFREKYKKFRKNPLAEF